MICGHCKSEFTPESLNRTQTAVLDPDASEQWGTSEYYVIEPDNWVADCTFCLGPNILNVTIEDDWITLP